MNLNHLESFLKIVEMGNFQKAADELFTTQSSLSKQMQSLEKELGVRLFDRSKRSAQLTQSGKTLLAQAPKLLLSYHELQEKLREAGHILNITVLPVWEFYGLTQVIADFSAMYPHVELQLHENPNANIAPLIDSGTHSLGIFRTVRPECSHWQYLSLQKDELVLVVPNHYPYQTGQHVSLKDFAQENFIMLGKETQLYEHSVKACQRAGFVPKVSYQGSSGAAIHSLVARGNGVALFMKHVALHQPQTENLILTFEETVKSELILAHNKNQPLNEAGRLFWNYTKTLDKT